ncbi:GntR family transcriptional regulator [Goodfellowiella coeruleoviolacea]|nr:GntR family transcriptional regulator [Goodfellowiella coeruleoviolacea]
MPLRRRVYEALLGWLTTGDLAPGQPLVEAELADRLSVPRQHVREALHWLHTEGWVDLRPREGACVHLPDEDAADQLLAMRCLLETESARLAAPRATASDAERLAELCEQGRASAAATDIPGQVRANARLHALITQLSGNQVLIDFAEQVERRARWCAALAARLRGAESWQEHADLVAAIARNNGEEAARIMRAHTERTRRCCRRRLREQHQKTVSGAESAGPDNGENTENGGRDDE